MSKDTETSNSIIHLLPPEISNKIAAGEVIQRPASVVKELLDNAIDAGADRVEVIIQNAGRTLIQVNDNGCGLSEEDIRPCFKRHATSKIQNVDDLFRIRTLGFRGEAMASIASVAQVTLKSKRVEDDMGYEYEIWGGEEKKFGPAAVDDGTSVAVRNLFYNVPARRQFLKTDATEFRHILRVIQQMALVNTDIAFKVLADTDIIYDLPAQGLKERIVDIFGKSYRESLIGFEEATSYVTIRGVVADPKLTKKSRGEQFIFVNGRPFQHRYLTHVILNIYDAWTGENEYPFYALFLEVDPTQVDVNVHPSKMEVKFEDERSIIKLTRSVVKKAINQHFMVPEVEKNTGSIMKKEFEKDFDSDLSFGTGRSGGSGGGGGPVKFPSRINFDARGGGDWGEKMYAPESGDEDPVPGEQTHVLMTEEELAAHSRDRGFWQLHDTYIVSQTRTGMCMIDQHAAHKRIVFEKALSATESALPSTQQLLFAQTVDFSASDFSLLKELHPIIQRMGFNVQLMSGNTAMLLGVPADINVGDERTVLKSVLHSYQELDSKIKLDAREKLAVAFANRTAIPRGKKLSDAEMETLIDQLFACDEPYVDPLRKPTIVYIPLDEIKSRFR